MALEIESPHRSIFDIESLSTMADTPIGLGNRLCAKLRPRYDHGLATATTTPWLASLWPVAPAGMRPERRVGRGWPKLGAA